MALGKVECTSLSSTGWHQFILNWCEQIHQLNELTGTQKHFSDYTKMIMLQNAVHPIQDLKQIKESAVLQKSQGRKDLNFTAYFWLVEAAVISYNALFDSKSHVCSSTTHQTMI